MVNELSKHSEGQQEDPGGHLLHTIPQSWEWRSWSRTSIRKQNWPKGSIGCLRRVVGRTNSNREGWS